MVTFTNDNKDIVYDTEKGFCYLDGGSYRQFKREYHAGQISYRIPKKSKRISRKQMTEIMKHCKPFQLKEIECPF
jgi:hypothetical protein